MVDGTTAEELALGYLLGRVRAHIRQISSRQFQEEADAGGASYHVEYMRVVVEADPEDRDWLVDDADHRVRQRGIVPSDLATTPGGWE